MTDEITLKLPIAKCVKCQIRLIGFENMRPGEFNPRLGGFSILCADCYQKADPDAVRVKNKAEGEVMEGEEQKPCELKS